jgi:acetolactate synthase-1/2/3 large subunit
MIKVSDYLAKRVVQLGVKHVFMISGGGAMHLNDSFGRSSELQYICNHHEQACAMAVEGYARTNGNIGVAIVTSGPGGTNTITGVLGAWLDSIPALFISGQIKYGTTVESTGLPLRQLGDQEANIVAIVRSITKYAVMVKDPKSIRYHFEKAVTLARMGRPGPVWLDIPLDVQAALIEPEELPAYDPSEDRISFNMEEVKAQATAIIERIRKAKRPVLLAGNGIRLSGAVDLFHEVIELLNIPVQTAIGAHDLIWTDHKLFFGRPSVTGDRSSSFIIQNADVLLSLGSRLGVRQVTYSYKAFAREAYKIVVDIDQHELQKPTIFPDMKVHCDAKVLLEELARQLRNTPLPPKQEWVEWCAIRRQRYPSVLPEYRQVTDYVNSYYFIEVLSKLMSPTDVIVLGDGTANTCTFQAISLKKGQRLFTNSGCASMGYDLPAAVGACFAIGKKQVICIAGDGSIHLNIQELQTIVHHRLPIKIFVLNNDGYLAIRSTQDAYFGGHYVASDSSSGVTLPDFVKIAGAYGLETKRIVTHTDMEKTIQEVLRHPGPVLCEINMSPRQTLYPKLASEIRPDGTMVSKPLEDMFPFLDRKEFLDNMIIKPWDPAER